MKKRGLILLMTLLMSFLSVAWLRSGDDGTVVAPVVDLTVIPAEIDDWQGVDIDLDDKTVVVMGATAYINRIYRDSSNRQIVFHAATWKNAESIAPAPHHPEVCYPGVGWTLLERRSVEVPGPSGPVPMELILFGKGDDRLVTGHWFSVGNATFVDADGFRKQRSLFWGLKYWPNSTKYLLQVAVPNLDTAEGTLVEFAALVNGLMDRQDAPASRQGA
jgi:EpsI family protein